MSNPTISFTKSPPPDPSSDEAAVLAVIEGLLDAVPSKDAASLLRYCHPGCGAARMRGPGQLLVETLEQVCHGISGLQDEVWERFVEPDVKVSSPFLFFFSRPPHHHFPFLGWKRRGFWVWRIEKMAGRSEGVREGNLISRWRSSENDLGKGSGMDLANSSRQIHNDLAMVWSKNEVMVDGKLVAVGCNAITLHKIGGEWKITSISDTALPPPAAVVAE
jgi:hypothetical protein